MATKIVILEQCEVAPSPGGPAEKWLPLLDFDVTFLRFSLMQILMFYELQCSKAYFLETIVPNLKNSLSLALNHFSPLAGNTTLPLTSGTPFTHYVAGDSVSLTIAQSDADFVHLTGNHYREAEDFRGFVSKLPEATYLPDSIKFPVAAFQVTFFPGRGLSLGVTMHHSIGDGATLVSFLRAWSSITKFSGDSHLLENDCLPFYDRSGVIKRLSTETWNEAKEAKPLVRLAVSPPTHNLRATLALSDYEIGRLKKSVGRNTSTTAIVCAYMWTCFAKSWDDGEVAGDDDEPQYLALPGDCRARLDPPLPDNYFGNCIAFILAESSRGKLRGKVGIAEAVVAIDKAIKETFNKSKEAAGVVDVSGYQEFRKLNRRRVLMVAGSIGFDLDGHDFGWGTAKKSEFIHVHTKETFSLSKPTSFEGVQIGLSMSRVEMDAFAAVFQRGITEASVAVAEQYNIFRSKI